jgi:hypothetical protein
MQSKRSSSESVGEGDSPEARSYIRSQRLKKPIGQQSQVTCRVSSIAKWIILFSNYDRKSVLASLSIFDWPYVHSKLGWSNSTTKAMTLAQKVILTILFSSVSRIAFNRLSYDARFNQKYFINDILRDILRARGWILHRFRRREYFVHSQFCVSQ